MNTQDKTGAKLVDSMRKTKAAIDEPHAGSANLAAAASKEKLPSQAKAKPSSDAQHPAAGTKAHLADPYQSGQRVWPD